MAEIVRMPKLSDTMTEGVVAVWHKKVGDKVKSGELLAEIETDKATMEFESYVDGILLHIGVETGQTAPVDSVLAIFGKEGEDISALLKDTPAPAAPVAQEKPVAAAKEKDTAKTEVVAEKASTPPVLEKATVKASVPDSNGRLKASPLARIMATEKGVDLQHVEGSGEGGRIIRRDIETATTHSGSARKALMKEAFTTENVSQMRKTIARRLAESKFSAPHFYLTMEIDMSAAMTARTAIIDEIGSKISFNDMVVKASALALRKNPNVNSSWLGDTVRRNQHVHIGIAVAVDEGLLVPVIRFTDSKSLQEINSEIKTLADKAKSKKLQPQEWEGNTFTISNLGMFGIEEFTAIINPPDACILAVGAIRQVPVVKDGKVVPGNVMKVTLSCDHRVVDGATGAAFLNDLKNILENPVLLFM